MAGAGLSAGVTITFILLLCIFSPSRQAPVSLSTVLDWFSYFQYCILKCTLTNELPKTLSA